MHLVATALVLIAVSEPAPDNEAVLHTLHPEVQKRIAKLESNMRRRRVVLNSGARSGDPADSLHNQSLAADVQVEGLTSVRVAKELRRAGFSCAIPYLDSRGRACRMAHGDLRHTPFAEGPYAPGSSEKQCPAVAVSKTGGCHNDSKGQWQYFRVWPHHLLHARQRRPRG